LIKTLLVSIRNRSAQPLADARLMVQVAGRNHYAADLVTVAPGAEVPVPVVVGGYDDLPVGAAPVGLTIVVSPNEGESATLQRSASVQVAEGALAVEVLPGEFTRGGSGSARFKLTNPSSLPIELKVASQQGSQASDEVRFKLLDPQGAILSSTPLQIVLGDDVVALPDGTTILRIPAGAAYTSPTVSVPVPSAAPAQVDLLLEIDSVYYHFGQGDTQVQLKGPQARQQASTVETAYRAEVTSVAPAESNGDQAIVEAMVKEFEKRRNVMVDRLNAIPWVTCMTPQGAFYVFPEIAGLLGRKYGGKVLATSSDVATWLLDEANVAVIPGGEFGQDDHIRLSYATSMSNIEKGLKRIRDAIMKLI